MGLFNKLFEPKPPSKNNFAKLVMGIIRGAGEKGKIKYEREQFRLRAEDGNVLFLGNAYQEYCSVPKASRPDLLKKWVRVWFVHQKPVPEEFEDARPDLLPVVRARSYYELISLRMKAEKGKDAKWPRHVLGEHFSVGLVYDFQEAMRTIGQDNLTTWGVTFYEALEAARHNLRQLPHPFIGPAEGEGVYLSAAKDSYDSSRILLTEVIRQFKVKGDPVAMIPNRDTLIVAGADDVEGLKAMLTLAEEAFQQPRYILGIALRLTGDEWEPWLPGPDHPLYSDFRIWHTRSMGQDYTEQKEWLDKLHEQTGEDIFVASCSAIEKKETGEAATYCVWAKGVLSLLPLTDLVAFMQEGREPVMAPWEKVVEVVGDLMEPTDMYPERFRVSEFPTEEQLAAMGNLLE